MHRFVALCALGLLLGLATPKPAARACTNILVTKGASADGATMITYAADSHTLYGELYYRKAAQHPAGALRKIFDWDTGKYLGQIKEAPRTYRVVGNMNEHQVVIGETTYGGRKELHDPQGGIDYGSMMYIALERARTAREAIKVMTDLVAEHGYHSEGESFSISDPNEVWIMDLIGKGKGEKGAVWVARRVPDGYVTAHANQPRIRHFPLDDPKNCIYSKDVISFARKKGYFKGADKDFAFADVYAPMTCRDLRIREARVWAVFRRVAPSLKIPGDYVKCKPGAKPMPLWVKPDNPLSVGDVTALMRDHFEGTEFDLGKDVGAGPYGLPYRWRPLVWKVKGKSYLNERAIATQQTGFSFVSQSRSWLPNPIGGVLWFSVDDAASTVYIPIYAGVTKVPKPYAVGTGSFTKFSWESAFWVFNWVANFAYSRYADIIKDIRAVQVKLERKFFTDQPEIERQALALHKQAPDKAEAFVTKYSVQIGEQVVARWRKLGEALLMKYLDGNIRDPKGKVTHPGYPKEWYERIVRETGDHFLIEDPPKKKKAAAVAVNVGKAQRPSGAEKKRVPSSPRAACQGCQTSRPASPWLFLLVFLAWIIRKTASKRGGR